MRVVGIDPGLTRCGVGVVEGVPGRQPTFIAAGVIRTPVDLDLPSRLLRLEAKLAEWLDEYAPDSVAVERVFAQHNLSSVTDTAQAAGIAMLSAARRCIPQAQHSPSEVKAAVCGNGRAEKAQVGAMVARILSLAGPPRPADAADALALAICHVWRQGTVNRYAEAAALAKGRR